MNRIRLQPAFILHRRPYRETSLLVEAFTRDYGRKGLVARGARRPGSGLRGMLEPFRPLLLSWSGRGELASLNGAEGAGGPPLEGRTLWSGFYLNELLQRLLARDDPHPDLFRAYASALARLQAGGNQETVLRGFERDLLDELGYGLLLEHEAEGGNPLNPDALYDYHLERGPVPLAPGGKARLPVRGRSLLALAADELDDPAVLREIKPLMRATLRLYLGDRPLKSRELFVAGKR